MAEKVRQRRKVEPKTTEKGAVDDNTGFIFKRRTIYNVDQELSEEMIRVPDFGGVEPARVRLGGSLTKNLGDYNSAKVEVMIELPCLPEISEVKRTVDLISAELDRIIPEEMDKNIAQEK